MFLWQEAVGGLKGELRSKTCSWWMRFDFVWEREGNNVTEEGWSKEGRERRADKPRKAVSADAQTVLPRGMPWQRSGNPS